ncbi:hypothetical protein BKA82DRAFT_2962549 [Pisolithus tinctorius]|nr:hypothetical protein BKA82DRAFT_2962549 [Pisolithus tinctorius]
MFFALETTMSNLIFLDRLDAVARIYCLRKGNLTSKIDLDGPFAETLGAIQNTGSQWPQTGSLIIQVNPGFPHGKTWLPYALDSPPFLDVTSCIVPGENVLRWISLSPMSDFVFVLCASPLPLAESSTQNIMIGVLYFHARVELPATSCKFSCPMHLHAYITGQLDTFACCFSSVVLTTNTF